MDNIKQILVGKKAIFFDFDGVILDSLDVREWGFRYIFSDQDPKLVQKLIDFHKANGGISRFYKIRYFHEVLLGSKISKEEVNSFAELFSKNMIPKLNNPSRLIMDTIGFIKENFRNYNMYIVSGSEQEELRWLCEKLSEIELGIFSRIQVLDSILILSPRLPIFCLFPVHTPWRAFSKSKCRMCPHSFCRRF